MEDQAFLEYLIKGIVSHPDDVSIDRKVDELGVLLTLKVNPEDMGQVIGKNGTTARAIRTLLRIIGMKSNARVNLKIEEPEGGSPRASKPAESQGESAPDAQQDVNIDESLGDLD